MPLTITEIYEKLKKLDEITLLEVLDITSEDLVERFQDFIEDKYEDFQEDFDEDEDNDDIE